LENPKKVLEIFVHKRVATLLVAVVVIWLIDVINVYNVYKKIFVNAFIILSTFISIKIT